MAAPAYLPTPTRSKRTAEPYELHEPHYCVFSAEGSCADGPLTSEPPLPDAAPLTSEPPLADAAPLTSEPTSHGAAGGLDARAPRGYEPDPGTLWPGSPRCTASPPPTPLPGPYGRGLGRRGRRRPRRARRRRGHPRGRDGPPSPPRTASWRERLLPPTVVLLGRRRARAAALAALPAGTRLRVRDRAGRDRAGVDQTAPGRPPAAPPPRPTAGPPGPPSSSPRPGCPAPPGRSHGLLVQLYSLLSARSWGMGDLGDLAELAAWAGRALGAGFVQVNPLHAAVPGAPTDPSPYRPSSRRFPDPVHLRVEDIPEYAYVGPPSRERARRPAGAGRAAARIRAGQGRVDRPGRRVGAQAARRWSWCTPCRSAPGRRAAYCDFLAEQGAGAGGPRHLVRRSPRCTAPTGTRWPAGLRDPRSAETARARRRADGPRRLPLPPRLAHRRPARRRAAGRPRGGHGRRHRPRPRRRGAPDGRRRLGAAGRTSPRACRSARPRTPSTRAARTGACRPGGPTAWPSPATPPTAACCARLLALRGRPAHRPRHGPVPALVGPAGRTARPRARTSATTPRPCSPSCVLEASPGRGGRDRRGPRHRRAGRPRGARPRAGCSARPCSGSSATGTATGRPLPPEQLARRLPGHRHHPRPAAHRRPAHRRPRRTAPPARPADPSPGARSGPRTRPTPASGWPCSPGSAC